MSKGRPITYYEREKIEVWLRMKKKKTWIAEKLNRDYSVIKREIKRNSGEHMPYCAASAQYYAQRRAKKTNVRKLEKWQNNDLRIYVEKRLREGWSPEEIAGRLKHHPPEELKKCKDRTISHESIYDYIYNGDGRYENLSVNLRRKRKRRVQKGCKRRQKKVCIPQRVSIDKRPPVGEVGHWETDSVIFRGRSILSVQFEKKSRLCRIHKCQDKSAKESEAAIQDSIESLPEYLWRSITRDNGSENVLHMKTPIPSYFCDPYCSWQKGGIENLNGLIREYFPRKSNLDMIEESEVYLVQEKLNNRPRKALGYLTPNEVIAVEI